MKSKKVKKKRYERERIKGEEGNLKGMRKRTKGNKKDWVGK